MTDTATKNLQDKVVLVTGASRGVGAVTATLVAERGGNVVINYRSKAKRAEQIAAQVEERGGKALIVEADVTDADAVAKMFATTKETFGRLDVLILNASGGLEKDVAADYAMVLNRDSQVKLAKAALSALVDGGRIVFVTSHLAHFHGEKPVMAEYEPVAASKKAGEVELRKLIPELAERNISLVVVSGDLIDGTITPKLLQRARPGIIDARRQEAGGYLPTTEDFAEAITTAAANPDLASGDTVYVGSTEWSDDSVTAL
jgi:NAD(P)-dependent dehydrogenase (short-subunit alcohol dehydrogenase family)